MEEEEANSKQNLTKREVEDDLGLSMLIDSQNNQYILTKPRDATIPRADHHFIKVVCLLALLSKSELGLIPTNSPPIFYIYVELYFLNIRVCSFPRNREILLELPMFAVI